MLSYSTIFLESLIILFIDFIYLRERERKLESTSGGEGEAGSPESREPNSGLNSRTLGS